MVRIRSLTQSDITEAKYLWELHFGDSPSFIDWFFQNRFHPETSVCAEKDGQIISILHGSPMRLQVRGKAVPAMMISGVATLKAYRGQGYMHQLMLAMLQICKDTEIPLAFNKPVQLNTYATVGFVPCTNAFDWHTPTDAPSHVRWDALPSIADLADCYAAVSARYSGCVLRSESEMRCKLEDYATDAARCLCSYTQNCLTGYLFAVQINDNCWEVPEIIAQTESDYQKLLARLPRNCSVKLPPDLPLAGERYAQNVMAVADAPLLLQTVCNRKDLAFSITDKLLPWNCGVFNGAGENTAAAADYAMTASQLGQLLLGYHCADERFALQDCFCVDEY